MHVLNKETFVSISIAHPACCDATYHDRLITRIMVQWTSARIDKFTYHALC